MRSKTSLTRTGRQITRRLDKALSHVDVPERPLKGWLRSVREALGMTQQQVARRLGVTRQAIASAEAAELGDSINMGRLRNLADALDCELQYVLVPRRPLGDMISDQARKRAEQKLERINRSQALEASAVSTSEMIDDLAQELEVNRPSELWDE